MNILANNNGRAKLRFDLADVINTPGWPFYKYRDCPEYREAANSETQDTRKPS